MKLYHRIRDYITLFLDGEADVLDYYLLMIGMVYSLFISFEILESLSDSL